MKYLHFLHRHLDDVMVYPSEAHLDLVIQVGPPRPVCQRPVQEGLDPGEAVREDGVERGAHPVYELHLHQQSEIAIFKAELTISSLNSNTI